MKALLPCVLVLFLCACAGGGVRGGFLVMDEASIVTLTEPAYEVHAPAGFRPAGPVETVDSSGNGAVSLAAWLGDEAFVTVRTAHGASGSGPLPEDAFQLPCGSFPTRTFCVRYPRPSAPGEDGVPFLQGHGFEVSPALWIRELRVPGAARGVEISFTYGERVAACQTPAPAVQAAFDTRLRERLLVTELGVGCAAPADY